MHEHLVDEWLRREWWVRDANSRGDLDVIDEVVTRDMYHMQGYAKYFPAPRLVLDIGAHIGTFSVLAKTLWPHTPVVAFEPNPESFELLQANTKEWTDVTCVNSAVSYGERPDLVYVDSIKSTGSGFVIERDGALDAMKWKDAADHMGYRLSDKSITSTTLEDHIPFPLPSGILIKLDAELAEVNVLNGLSDKLAVKTIFIAGEYHCEGGWREFLDRVDLRRFRLWFEPYSADHAQPIGLFRALPKSI